MPATSCQGTCRLPASAQCSRAVLPILPGQPQLRGRLSVACGHSIPTPSLTPCLQANWSDGQASNGELVQLSVNHRRTYSEGELQQMETGVAKGPSALFHAASRAGALC